MKIPLLTTLLASFSFGCVLCADPGDATQERTPETYFVSERGPHHRVWEKVRWETNEVGEVTGITNSYTELGTGMHVQKDGEWIEADARIEITPDGASASHAAYQVNFSPSTAGGIDLLTSDGKRLRSRVLGLSYFDSATGEAVLIAELKDVEGFLVGENEVIYRDAFDGEGVKADVQYFCTLAGLEQNIVFREPLPAPEAFKLNGATTRLQVLTEFFDSPAPIKEVTAAWAAGILADETLDFGAMRIGSGKAFAIGEVDAAKGSIPVAKQWTVLEGRTFLVEEVPFEKAAPFLNDLDGQKPQAAIHPRRTGRGETVVAALGKSLPNPARKQSTGTIREAKLSTPGHPAFVLDYSILTAQTNFTFKGDSTYYVTNTVNLSGTTQIEGGAVIKFTNSTTAKISISGALLCQTDPYRPAVFTAKDDNTVGETIAGSSGTPGTTKYGNGLTFSTSGTTLNNLRFSYANTALSLLFSSGQLSMTNMQFINCAYPIDFDGNSENTVNVDNSLFYSVTNVTTGGYDNYLRGSHLTVNQCLTLFKIGNGNHNGEVYLTNSIFVGVNQLGDADVFNGSHNGFSNTTTFGSSIIAPPPAGTNYFQTVGAASHYLADNTFRNQGTTNLSTSLLSSLSRKTTYPPIVLTNNFTSDTTLSPQAQRDTDTPDLGYHYDPIDYVVSGSTVTNAILTFTNGVIVGTSPGANSNPGVIYVQSSGKIISEGTATLRNRLVRYNTVQEQTVTSNLNNGTFVYFDSNATSPDFRCRFTDWSALSGSGDHVTAYYVQALFKFIDCQFAGSQLYLKGTSVALTNCLWERASVNLNDDDEALNRYIYNNTFKGGTLTLLRGGTGVAEVRDTLFDQTTISQSGTITHDHNGYITNSNRLTPNGSGDIILTNVPVYQTSYLGKYYYPTNDGMLSLLINAGSRNATNAGLYHFTTTTNQVKETNTTVDIGFHYVGVDSNGNSIDTDGDGLPDYLEDRNGNGAIDSGETSPTDPNDLGLKVIITRPWDGAILP